MDVFNHGLLMLGSGLGADGLATDGAHRVEFVDAVSQELLVWFLAWFVDRARYGRAKGIRRRVRVAVCPPDRFFDDLIHDIMLDEIVRRQFKGFRRVLLVIPRAPQNRRTALGRYHGVPRVFKHQDAVTNADAKRTSG